jgi:predicted secreted protein
MADTHILTADDNGSRIAIGVGETFLLEFEQNPTTGYLWQIEPTDGVLDVITDDFTPAEGIGAGGLRRIRFACKEPGHLTLRLSLAREWDRENPLKSWSADVTVLP